MRAFLIRWLVSAITLTALAQGLDGFHVDGLPAAVLAVAVLAVGNLLLQPVAAMVRHLGCLLNLLTLGLFEGAVNLVFFILAFYLIGTLNLVEGFQVDTVGAAVSGALVLSLVNLLIRPFVVQHDDRKKDEREPRRG